MVFIFYHFHCFAFPLLCWWQEEHFEIFKVCVITWVGTEILCSINNLKKKIVWKLTCRAVDFFDENLKPAESAYHFLTVFFFEVLSPSVFPSACLQWHLGLGTLKPVIMANDENVSMCDAARRVWVCGQAHLYLSLCLRFFKTWMSRLPVKAYWWRLAEILSYPVWALAAEGLTGRQRRSGEPPLLFSCENDRPAQKAV